MRVPWRRRNLIASNNKLFVDKRVNPKRTKGTKKTYTTLPNQPRETLLLRLNIDSPRLEIQMISKK